MIKIPAKTWGTPQLIKDYIVVNEQVEVPPGEKAYVFNKSTMEADHVPKATWEEFMAGDLTALKEKIEMDIPDSKVIWLQIHWDAAHYFDIPIPPYQGYTVYGFYIEAIVENMGSAALTGLEIISIIFALAFLAVVIAAIALGAWIVWTIMTSVPVEVMPIVGIIILAGIGIFLLALLKPSR